MLKTLFRLIVIQVSFGVIESTWGTFGSHKIFHNYNNGHTFGTGSIVKSPTYLSKKSGSRDSSKSHKIGGLTGFGSVKSRTNTNWSSWRNVQGDGDKTSESKDSSRSRKSGVAGGFGIFKRPTNTNIGSWRNAQGTGSKTSGIKDISISRHSGTVGGIGIFKRPSYTNTKWSSWRNIQGAGSKASGSKDSSRSRRIAGWFFKRPTNNGNDESSVNSKSGSIDKTSDKTSSKGFDHSRKSNFAGKNWNSWTNNGNDNEKSGPSSKERTSRILSSNSKSFSKTKTSSQAKTSSKGQTDKSKDSKIQRSHDSKHSSSNGSHKTPHSSSSEDNKKTQSKSSLKSKSHRFPWTSKSKSHGFLWSPKSKSKRFPWWPKKSISTDTSFSSDSKDKKTSKKSPTSTSTKLQPNTSTKRPPTTSTKSPPTTSTKNPPTTSTKRPPTTTEKKDITELITDGQEVTEPTTVEKEVTEPATQKTTPVTIHEEEKEELPAFGPTLKPPYKQPKLCQKPTPSCCIGGVLTVDLNKGRNNKRNILDGVSLLGVSKGEGRNKKQACSSTAVVVVDFDKLENTRCFGCLEAPYCGKRMLKIQLHLSNARRGGWLFNVGDSDSNNGYGGDDNDQINDAETQGLFPNITVYPSEKCPTIKSLMHIVDAMADNVDTVTLYISNEHIRITNSEGLDFKLCHTCLYALNGQQDSGPNGVPNETICIGLNRVVKDITRSGYGVCSATFSWECPWCS